MCTFKGLSQKMFPLDTLQRPQTHRASSMPLHKGPNAELGDDYNAEHPLRQTMMGRQHFVNSDETSSHLAALHFATDQDSDLKTGGVNGFRAMTSSPAHRLGHSPPNRPSSTPPASNGLPLYGKMYNIYDDPVENMTQQFGGLAFGKEVTSNFICRYRSFQKNSSDYTEGKALFATS